MGKKIKTKEHEVEFPVPTEVMSILLVEDDEADVSLLERALKKGRVPTRMHVAPTGEEALDFLRTQGQPDIVLLDLNLPGKDGKTVLSEIRGDALLKRIPVAIMSSSEAKRDINESYDLGANCYIPKPGNLAELQTVVGSIEDFWFRVARLPESRRPLPAV